MKNFAGVPVLLITSALVVQSPTIAAELTDRALWTATASSGNDPALGPELAIDNDMATRWSSDFSDPQWLTVDLGAKATVCGLVIHWETAYASAYDVLVSLDGEAWTRVYSTTCGDGGVDDIFFAPAEARYVSLHGVKRGTGWGYSVFELYVKGEDELPKVEADSVEVVGLFDGDATTTWTAPNEEKLTLDIDFGVSKALAGLRIDWAGGRTQEISLSCSADGESWRLLVAPPFNGEYFDVLMHEQIEARYLRLALGKPTGDKPLAIAELSLADLRTSGNLLAAYRIAAQSAPRGVYPMQLLDEQVYWTVVGLPADPEESLLDEYGNLEPFSGGCMLQPFVYADGTLHTPAGSQAIEHALVDGRLPLPSVRWWAADMPVDAAALTRGEVGNSTTYVRYRITNSTNERRSGKLLLAVRPLQINPPWQHGGLSNIHNLAMRTFDDMTSIEVDSQPTFVCLPAADQAGVRAFQQGDIGQELVNGSVPQADRVHDENGLASGVLAYSFDLAPGESRTVVVAAALGGALVDVHWFSHSGESLEAAFDRALDEQAEFWRARLPGPLIELPDKDVADMLVAQIAYILINQDRAAIQPGSRNYNRSWMRDGSSSMDALLHMGLSADARRWVEWYAARVQPDGLVPPILNTDGTVYGGFGSNIEWDSQGQFLHALAEYYRLTEDRNTTERYLATATKALRYLERLRALTHAQTYMAEADAPERFRDILPPSISHEGYNPPVHSYWDDFFALKGLRDVAFLAGAFDHANVEARALKKHDELRSALKRSIDATIRHYGIDFIPGCADKGDFDATSTAVALYPCEEAEILDKKLLQHTFDSYYDDLVERREPTWQGQFTPYELRSIVAFIKLGQPKRANDLLDYMMTCRRPAAWNHLGEVVHAEYRKNAYLGDLPHTWVGAEFVNAVRGMLVLEENDAMHLLPGVLPRWIEEGSGIRIRELPTYFGRLDLRARAVDGIWHVDIDGASPPAGYVLHVNTPQPPQRVVVDDVAADYAGEGVISLPAGTRAVRIAWD